MGFDYDKMPTRGKEHSNGEPIRECNNCGERTYMRYEENRKYKVVCEHCEEEHDFTADSMDHAMELWRDFVTIADCENCPLGWEERGYEGECYDCGCLVYEEAMWCVKPFHEREAKANELESEVKG